MKSKLIFFLITWVAALTCNAQPEILKLWPEGAPGAITSDEYVEQEQLDKEGEVRGYSQIWDPELILFPVNHRPGSGTAVLICPGGGYGHLATRKEGYRVAEWLNSLGVSAFVLKYRMPSDKIMKNKTIGPLQDAQKAMRMIRRNAEKWNLDPNRIGVMGFSAGGHLASTLSTHYRDKVYDPGDTVSAKPSFSILIYPVISMRDSVTHGGSRRNLLGNSPSVGLVMKYSNELQINKETPPAFLVHSTDDRAVPVENSIRYYMSLTENNISSEMHIYEKGGHGFGLGRNGTNKNWPEACENWLKANRLIPMKRK